MRVLISPQNRQGIIDGNATILLNLFKGMINGCQSLLSDIVSYVINKVAIENAVRLGWKIVFNSSYFLGSQEDT